MHEKRESTAVRPATSQSGFSLYLLGCALVAALGGLLFGFDTAVISGTTPFLQAYFRLDDITLGWTVSSLLLGWFLFQISQMVGLIE